MISSLKKSNNPNTGYLSIICFLLIVIFNCSFLFVHIFTEGAVFADGNIEPLFELFFISWTLIPYFIIEIAGNEISVLSVSMYLFIAMIISAYLVLPFIALKRRSKTINGILMVVLFIDIVISMPMLFSNPIIGVINISIKVCLMFLCLRNIKWYNENYEIV